MTSLVSLGGRLRFFRTFWEESVTNDPWVLHLISGAKIDFYTLPTNELSGPNPNLTSEVDRNVVSQLVEELIEADVVEEVFFTTDLVINPIFAVQNHNGSHRLILNSKAVNTECVPYNHFKMESLECTLAAIQPGDWLSSLDIRKGFHHIPLHREQRRFFAFEWQGKFFVFKALPMGLREAPRLFTVVMKALLTPLRARGIRIYVYIDDTVIAERTKGKAVDRTNEIRQFFEKAGFLIHDQKSVLVPTQRIRYLGFVIDTVDMVLELPFEKFRRLRADIRWLRTRVERAQRFPLRKFAQIIGFLLSCIPAIPYAKYHFRSLEIAKNCATDFSLSWDQEISVRLTQELEEDLQWWGNLTHPVRKFFRQRPVDHVIATDASLGGWGAKMKGLETAGCWAPDDDSRIDLLELRAVRKALLTLPVSWEGKNICFRIDNKVAVSYVNKGGGRICRLHREARELWSFLEEKNALATAVYVPSRDNPADALSRLLSRSGAQALDAEWKLKPDLFSAICVRFKVEPTIDWFATSLNTQLPRFVSWGYEVGATEFDAFLCDWGSEIGYCFPPFCLLTRTIRKILDERATCILIHPKWFSQPWWPDLQDRVAFWDIPTGHLALTLPQFPQMTHRLVRLQLQASLFRPNSTPATRFSR